VRVIFLSVVLAVGGMVVPVAAQAIPQSYQLNISRQPLDAALKDFAQQTGLQVARFSDLPASNVLVGPVNGEMSIDKALRSLLAPSQLTYKFVNDHTIAVVALSQVPTGAGSVASPADTRSTSAEATQQQQEGKKSSSGTFRVAQLDQGQAGGATAVAKKEDTATANNSGQLEEVIVSAQKRSEKLLDVPTAISAISGDRLEALQVNSLADIADYVPGLAVIAGGAPGYRDLIIRGINSSSYNNSTGPLVGTYIDDLPVGSSSNAGRGAQYGIDIPSYDIEHVEVLKGPQGTLYGADAMGGLIKYVLRKPDPTQFDAQVGSDASYIDGSGGANWGVHGAINMPIVTGKLALRVSAFDKENDGYIDNIGIGVKDSNVSRERSGLATLLWNPTDQLVVSATALAQNSWIADMTGVTVNAATGKPAYGPLTVNTRFPEPYSQQLRNYSLSINWNLEFATLTSATGYSSMNNTTTQDLTDPYGSYCAACPAGTLANWILYDDVSKFVEEVRLTSPENQRIQWMVGGYYTRENSFSDETIPTYTPTYVPLPASDNVLIDGYPYLYKEAAAFANLTYRFNERFDVSGGVRYSEYSEHVCPYSEGIFGSGPESCSSLPSTGVSVWMANTRFHLNENAMLYARVATGFRPGSGCPTCGNTVLGTPGVIQPDKTTDYEVGFKGQFFDQRLQIDTAVFYIDWTDIQLALETPNEFGYPGNGGNAVSKGFELTAAYQIIKDLRLNATFSYTDAYMTEVSPAAHGVAVGDTLPSSPRFSSALTADYKRPLDGDKSLLLGGGYHYRDAVVNNLGNAGIPTPIIGPQNIFDLYAGLVIRKLTLRLYATNVFDNRSYSGLLYISDPKFPRLVPVQPRTIGLSADYRFR
jgi:iron complex outermembrane recepter protein